MSDEPLLGNGRVVVWVTEITELPAASRRSARDAMSEERRWVVHVERGTATGIDYSAEREFETSGAAVAWAARGQGDLVLVRTIDLIAGSCKFSAGTASHPWPPWPQPI